jgi:hypothetical protein
VVGARRIVLIAVAGVAALAVGVGAVAYATRQRAISRYEPLRASGVGGVNGDGVVPAPQQPPGEDPVPAALQYRDGATVDVLAGVANDGRWGITVTGVDISGQLFTLERSGYLGPDARVLEYNVDRPFGRFRLDPDRVATIVLHLRVTRPCFGSAANTFVTLNSMRVHYE